MACGSLQIVTALNGASMDVSPIGPIIEDAKVLLLLIAEATASHIRRQANSVAHKLARFALHSGGDSIWVEETPSLISDLVEEDNSTPCTS
ncbi:hypothetical protein C1H46_033348 [Malus baccata]|uniref:RNase H type-1 domain-containing protein n=1 Tax=Malus baccata TaxID=106549 RepID=A0A540L426_MALBA|nr:hypothetical protein C1H46_033348 [Malus baccata]